MFTLSIPISASNIDAIKLKLTKALPEVKSSHRCEAIARGFGFRTYASLLAKVRGDSTPIIATNGAAFSGYLASHGLSVPSVSFYDAVAYRAIHLVGERIPSLTARGIAMDRPRRKEDGQRETLGDVFVRFKKERAELLNDYSVKPFLASLAFMSRVEKTKTLRPKVGSYWLKHIAKNYVCSYPEGDMLGPCYVKNGLLIAAAVYAGFYIGTHIEESGYESPNTTFNMSYDCLVDLDCEIRPNGAHARTRRHREAMQKRAKNGLQSTYF